MPIDPKEALGYLGIDPEAIETMDDFKANVDTTYVRREMAHVDKEITGKVFGKINGTLRNKLKGVGKELGVEANWDELDPTEGIDHLGRALKDSTTKLRTELEGAKKGGASTKEITEIKEKYEAQVRELDALRSNAKEWELKYTELDSTVKQREAKAKEDAFYNEAFSELKWNEGVSDFAKTGFASAFREAYKPDFYEGGVRVMDKEGKIVMDPNKAQTFRSHKELAKEWAEKEKLIGGQAPAPAVRKVVSTTAAGLGVQPTETPANVQGGRPTRRVMPLS